MTEEIKTPVENAPVEASVLTASESDPVRAALSVSRTSRADLIKLALPASIVIAALMISGTLLYVKFSGGLRSGNTTVKQVLTVENLKKWAKQLKLDTKSFNACLDSGKYKDEVAKDVADGQAGGVNGTPTFFVNGRILVGALPYEQFKAAIDQALKTKPLKTSKTPGVDDDPSFGSATAPVTIIEFSDFECSYCRRWWKDTYPQIKLEYINTGKALFVHRDYPLPMHQGAQPAAQASQCANEQGKYWEMFDKIFSEQEKAAK